MHGTSRHPIGVVATRTGIAPDLLRAWEKRYAAVTPGRGPTGRRLYSDEDIERLRLLKSLVGSGRRISDVASLAKEELLALAREDELETVSEPPRHTKEVGTGSYLSEALDALERFDKNKLQGVLSDAAISLSGPKLRRQFLVPLLQSIGDRWREGTLRIAHEHLASAVIRSFLASLANRAPAVPSTPRLLVTTPAGQRHELGALLVTAVAEEYGWDVAYLGPDLPAEEIAVAVRTLNPRAIALSIIYKNGDRQLQEELRKLVGYLQNQVPVFVGGRATDQLKPLFEELGIHVVKELSDLTDRLQAIQS